MCSLGAHLYIGGHLVAGAAILYITAAHCELGNIRLFCAYLLTALIASRLQVCLPGVRGAVSVGFLFVFIAILDLTRDAAILIAAASTLLQAVWRAKLPQQAVRIGWNVSSIAIAVFASSKIYGSLLHVAPALLALGVLPAVYFAINACSIAGVVALTESKPFIRLVRPQLWLLPYYLCGTSIAWLIGTISREMQWQLPIVCLPVVWVIHRSYTKHLAQMEQEKKHAEEMNNLHLRTIETLAMAIDARDHETHGHLQRVRTYAVAIGREMGLSRTELNALDAASVLHDIGKLAVPEHIILKPGKLTPAEFEKMKVHTVVGGEIVNRVKFPYPVAPIVRAHHEKWNGAGYPDGLQGEQIPLGARILSAVDCLDALASDRSYRRALPLDNAMARIASESGSSFDPKVIGVLQRQYRELEALAREAAASAGASLSTGLRISAGDAPAAGFADTTSLSRFAKALEDENQDSRIRLDVTHREAIEILAARLGAAVPHDALALFVSRQGCLYPEHVFGGYAAHLRDTAIQEGAGLIGWVAQRRSPMVNGNPETAELRSALAVPVIGSSGAPAVLSLYRSEPDAFSQGDLAAVKDICLRAGFPPDISAAAAETPAR